MDRNAVEVEANIKCISKKKTSWNCLIIAYVNTINLNLRVGGTEVQHMLPYVLGKYHRNCLNQLIKLKHHLSLKLSVVFPIFFQKTVTKSYKCCSAGGLSHGRNLNPRERVRRSQQPGHRTAFSTVLKRIRSEQRHGNNRIVWAR